MKIIQSDSIENPNISFTESEIQTPSKKKNSEKTLKWTKILLLCSGTLLILSVFVLIQLKRKQTLHIEDLFIAQPFVEDNDISSFVLSNGLKVLVIKPNSNYKNSYISLTVGVGSEMDPPDFIGFTHLIEHLLFTGSKSYPQENYIEKVCDKYQGQNNGVTKAFTTSYYYSIDGEGFSEFSEVLVDAIVNPLFDVKNISKEINNVNSEISMRMTFNKQLGVYKLLKKIGNKNSKLFSDGFGNIQLSQIDFENLRQKMIDFHQKYYSANLMTLVVISDEDIKEIKKIIRQKYSQIPNKKVTREKFEKSTSNPFSENMFGEIYYMQGFDDASIISVSFQLDSFKNDDFQPLDFFSTYLNFDFTNSFKQFLIQKEFIIEFGDELLLQDFKNTIYKVSFQLTEKGEKNVSEVLKIFFNFIEMIKELKNKEIFYKSLRKITQYNFLFNNSSPSISVSQLNNNPFDRVVDFSEALQEYDFKKIFSEGKIMKGYNEKKFMKLLNQLNPENCVFIYESKKFQKSKVIQKDPNFESDKNSQKQKYRELLLLGRKLDEQDGQEIHKNYFLDDSLDRIELLYELDFDENRKYFHQKLPKKLLHSLKQNQHYFFEIMNEINTDYITSYDMITKCPIPKSLQTKNHQSISFEKMYDCLLEDHQTTQINIQQMKELTSLKLCMIKEFIDDDNIEKPTLLIKNKKYQVYHKLYRKQLENKYVTYVELEAPLLIATFMNTEQEKLTQNQLQLEMVCLYLISHMELYFSTDFAKGYKFDCDISNFVVILQFQGVSSGLYEFQTKIINNIRSLQNGALFQQKIIQNLKTKILNKYSNFDQISSLDSAQYFLKKTLDKLFIDYSSQSSLELISDLIEKTSETDFQLLIGQFLQGNKQTYLYVGNISSEAVIKQTKQLNRLLCVDQSVVLNEFEFRKKVTQGLILQLQNGQHFLSRIQNINQSETNNVYLTYFKFDILTKKEKVFGLTVEKMISTLVFDELRNKLNLGYVAHAGLKVFYHNLGLIILIQGENFRPNQIEHHIEGVLQKLLQQIEKKDEEYFKDWVLQNVADILQFPDDLEQLTTKLFYHLQEEKINEDYSNYIDIVKNFKKTDLVHFVRNYLIDRQQRITIEMFSNKISDVEKNFQMNQSLSLNGKEYTIIDYNLLSELKVIVN